MGRNGQSANVEPVSHSIFTIPVRGTVPCGPSAFDHTQLTGVRLQKAISKGTVSGFIVTGGSMTDAGITDHDIILCHHDLTPKVGSIVVARSESNEYTCKRWNGKRLQGESGGMITGVDSDCDWGFIGKIEQVIKPMAHVEQDARRLRSLKSRVTELEATVKEQAAEIATLKKLLAER